MVGCSIALRRTSCATGVGPVGIIAGYEPADGCGLQPLNSWPYADVKVAIARAKCHMAAVVHYGRLLDRQKDLLATGVGPVGIIAGYEPADGCGSLGIRVAHVKAPFCGVGWREGQADQTLFNTTADALRNIEERQFVYDAVLDDADAALLLKHEDPAAAVAGVRFTGGAAIRSDGSDWGTPKIFHSRQATQLGLSAVKIKTSLTAWGGSMVKDRNFPVFGIGIGKARVEGAQAGTVAQPYIMRGWPGRRLRDLRQHFVHHVQLFEND